MGLHSDGIRDDRRQRWKCPQTTGVPWINGAEKLECTRCKTCKTAAFKETVQQQAPSVYAKQQKGGASSQVTDVDRITKRMELRMQQMQATFFDNERKAWKRSSAQGKATEDSAPFDQYRKDVLEEEPTMREAGSISAKPPSTSTGDSAQLCDVEIALADLEEAVRAAGGGELVESLPKVLRGRLAEMVAKKARVAEPEGGEADAAAAPPDNPEAAKPLRLS
ncbi:unnamed protein product, partial [Prorocentrum cordatum]